jgi:hypothetical protein
MKTLRMITTFTLLFTALSAYSSSIEDSIRSVVEKSLPKSLKAVESAQIIDIATSLGETFDCLVSPLKCNNREKEFDSVIRLVLEDRQDVDFHCKISGTKKASKIIVNIYQCKYLGEDKAFKFLLEGKRFSYVEKPEQSS